MNSSDKLNLVSLNCNGFKNKVNFILNSYPTIDLFCFQEHWLPSEECSIFNTNNPQYCGYGNASFDNTKLRIGRPFGGVGFMWKKVLDKHVTIVNSTYDWLICIRLFDFYIINIYLPYESPNNIDLFEDRLVKLFLYCELLNTSNFCIIGDFNSNISNHNSKFSNILLKYCTDTNIVMSDKIILNSDSYTCVSSAWKSCSWLDHILSTHNMHTSIIDIKIDYDFIISDHHPLVIVIRQNNVPRSLFNKCVTHKIIKWNRLNRNQILKYNIDTKVELCILINHIYSFDINHNYSEYLYNSLINILLKCSKDICFESNNSKYARSEWNSIVKEKHCIARSYYLTWIQNKKPLAGICYDNMVNARKHFKYELRHSKLLCKQIEADNIALNIISDRNNFWKLISNNLKKKSSIPNNIENAHGIADVTKFWFDNFNDIFNSTNSIPYPYNKINVNEIVYTNTVEISSIIDSIKGGKSVGPDGISIEHISNSNSLIIQVIVLLINNMLHHSYFPKKLILSYILPIIKNKNKRSNDSSNYRPICISNIICKLIEKVIYNRISSLLVTLDNQFGFKKNLGTEMCVFALKQYLKDYYNNNTNIFVAFLDASKAFDKINHNILFHRLKDNNVPSYIINFLNYWYRNQRIYIKWGDNTSNSFPVSNGIRQGGILSPLLFNIYTNPMIVKLNQIKSGYCLNGKIINNLCYADDTALFSPSLRGLQLLINCCEEFAGHNFITYNIDKSVILPIYYGSSIHNPVKLYIGNTLLNVVKAYKYLGHWISEDLSDDIDIYNNIKQLYKQSYMIANNFSHCSKATKIILFKSFVSNIYLSSIWLPNRANMQKIKVAYNNAYRIVMKYKRRNSASLMFLYDNVNNLTIKLRKSYNSLYQRIRNSRNSLIIQLYYYNILCPSQLFTLWYKSVFR